MSSNELIHDRGRGPEIKDTRITVYAILDFLIAGWQRERIAELFRRHPEEIQAVIDFIGEHKLEILREYVKILERSASGNPPELQAELDARHEQFQRLLREVREAKAAGKTDVRSLIEEFREARAAEAAHAGNHGGS
jgi:uncharacterized protein (DUF433 family)